MRYFWLAFALLFAAASAQAEKHALILAIGEYRGGAKPLRGVRHDVESARRIALAMGVPDRNILVYRDADLTLAGMGAAFDAFEKRVDANDQAFIYFSGHGGRYRVEEENGRCAEALIAVDSQPFLDVTLEQRLKSLASRASRIVVLIDACHSGGVTTRAAPSAAGLTPKFFARTDGTACDKPVNVVTRSIHAASRKAGEGGQNYVYVAAAREDEVSLDDPDRGGLATRAWLECATGAAQDLDRSGGISADEIRVCAQERIHQRMKGVRGFLPQNIAIAGNAKAVMKFADAAPVHQPASSPAPAVAAPPPQKPAQAPVAAPPAAAQRPAAHYTLLDLFNSRDDRRAVQLLPSAKRFRIGADPVQFQVTSTHPGYVYVLMVGSDGKQFDLLFPNRVDRDNLIEAGQTLRLPRPSWQITAGGPPGRNQLLALVTDSPRDFSGIGMSSVGPFSMLRANALTSKDIQLVTTSPPSAQEPECADQINRRNLLIQRRCSTAYGAAMTEIEEVN